MKQIDGYKIYLNQIIGKGSYGAVYIGVSDKTNQKVAVKILSKSNSKLFIIQSMLTLILKMHFYHR